MSIQVAWLFGWLHRSEVDDVLQQIVGALDSSLLHYFYDSELSSDAGEHLGQAQPIEEG